MNQEFTIYGNIDGEKEADLYRLSFTADGGFFLSNSAGEGMVLSEQNLFAVLDEYFQREF